MDCEDKMRWPEIELFLKFVKGITTVEDQSIQNQDLSLSQQQTHTRGSAVDSSLAVSCQLLGERSVRGQGHRLWSWRGLTSNPKSAAFLPRSL